GPSFPDSGRSPLDRRGRCWPRFRTVGRTVLFLGAVTCVCAPSATVNTAAHAAVNVTFRLKTLIRNPSLGHPMRKSCRRQARSECRPGVSLPREALSFGDRRSPGGGWLDPAFRLGHENPCRRPTLEVVGLDDNPSGFGALGSISKRHNRSTEATARETHAVDAFHVAGEFHERVDRRNRDLEVIAHRG